VSRFGRLGMMGFGGGSFLCGLAGSTLDPGDLRPMHPDFTFHMMLPFLITYLPTYLGRYLGTEEFHMRFPAAAKEPR